MSKKIYNVKKINQMKCIAGIVMGSIMAVLAFIGILLNIANFYKDTTPEAGMGTFRMFTTLSNILVCCATLSCIPYQIDGLRKKHYHLPKWIVVLLYIGTTGVALTFFIAITAISIAQGFVKTMFGKSNIFLHTIIPICAIVLFTFVNCDHKIDFKKSFYTFLPVGFYALIYLIMAIFIGESHGGWRDVYQFNAYIPWPLTMIIMFSIVFGIANLLRFLHNKKYKQTENSIEDYYKLSPDFNLENIDWAVEKLAKSQRVDIKNENVEVPIKVINLLKQRFESEKSLDELSSIYVKAYFNE